MLSPRWEYQLSATCVGLVLVHALLYANDMDIAAIIQTNSCFQKHGWSREPWLEQMIDAYGKVLPQKELTHNKHSI